MASQACRYERQIEFRIIHTSKVAGRKASRKDKAGPCHVSSVPVGHTFGRVLKAVNPERERRKIEKRMVRNRRGDLDNRTFQVPVWEGLLLRQKHPLLPPQSLGPWERIRIFGKGHLVIG